MSTSGGYLGMEKDWTVKIVPAVVQPEGAVFKFSGILPPVVKFPRILSAGYYTQLSLKFKSLNSQSTFIYICKSLYCELSYMS